jgi:hypothetical protein
MSIRCKIVGGVHLFTVLPPRNYANIQTYREAGGGLSVYVCDIIPCIKELIICKDVLP